MVVPGEQLMVALLILMKVVAEMINLRLNPESRLFCLMVLKSELLVVTL